MDNWDDSTRSGAPTNSPDWSEKDRQQDDGEAVDYSYRAADTDTYTYDFSDVSTSPKENAENTDNYRTDASYGGFDGGYNGASYSDSYYGSTDRSYVGPDGGSADAADSGYDGGPYDGLGAGSDGGFGNGSDDGSGDGFTPVYVRSGRSGRQKKPKEKKTMQITRLGFISALIFTMIMSSALSFGGMYYYMEKLSPGTDSATNYKLTKTEDNLSYKSIVSKTNDSVVSIKTEGMTTDSWMQNYITQGAGSGVIIQSNGYILTCQHVIDNATKITVTLSNQKEYRATVIGEDAHNDLAVIKINATGLTSASYGDSSALEVGDEVIAIGNPLGELSNTATTGIISATNRNLVIDGEKRNLLQTDASISPGNSGGGLFDSSGNLIGIVEAKSASTEAENLGFAIPINRAAKIAKDMIENKDSKGKNSEENQKGLKENNNKALIGVTIVELSESEAMQYGYMNGGVYITDVNSPYAKEAGLQEGDMFYSVDGKKVSASSDLTEILSDHKAGDKVKVVVIRDGREWSTKVELISKSQSE